PAVARLARSAPGIRIRVQDAEGDASLPMVLDRQVDVAVAVEYRGASADDPRLTHLPLYAEPFDAVVPVSHRLADAAEVPLAVLACEHAGFQPRLEHSSDDFRAVVALAAADVGVALVPRSALRGTDLAGVVVRPVDGAAPTRRVFAAVRRGAEEHPLIRPVLDALGEAAEQA